MGWVGFSNAWRTKPPICIRIFCTFGVTRVIGVGLPRLLRMSTSAVYSRCIVSVMVITQSWPSVQTQLNTISSVAILAANHCLSTASAVCQSGLVPGMPPFRPHHVMHSLPRPLTNWKGLTATLLSKYSTGPARRVRQRETVTFVCVCCMHRREEEVVGDTVHPTCGCGGAMAQVFD